RHRAFSHRHRDWAASGARAAWPDIRPVPTDLCSGYSRRLRQGADRPLRRFPAGGLFRMECRGPSRPPAHLSSRSGGLRTLSVTEPNDRAMIIGGGGAIALGTTQEHRILSLFSL